MSNRGAVFFDLDDTLIDSTGLLIPDALRRTAEALGVTPERLDATGKTTADVTGPLGPLAPDRLSAADRAWNSPDVPPLDPVPGARELLATLRPPLLLFLVTRGDAARQQQKIDRAGLREAFDAIRIRPPCSGSKRDDFAALAKEWSLEPTRCVVIGDDRADEIAHGDALGFRTILVPDTPLRTVPQVLRNWRIL
ncbi:MAG: HAD family hydrolase [Planctomycetota bacterium]